MDFPSDMGPLEVALGHQFAHKELLVQALTHSSHANERRDQGVRDNERLEFLGDAVIDLVIGHHLMTLCPAAQEGVLSMARARLVSADALAGAARALDLGSWLRLGKGEEASGGRDKSSLLADTFEAVVAAVFLDAGFQVAQSVVIKSLGSAAADAAIFEPNDSKTQLQERVQRVGAPPPVYELVRESGPDHDKTFYVVVLVNEQVVGAGQGKSKKLAEREAADEALRKFR